MGMAELLLIWWDDDQDSRASLYEGFQFLLFTFSCDAISYKNGLRKYEKLNVGNRLCKVIVEITLDYIERFEIAIAFEMYLCLYFPVYFSGSFRYRKGNWVIAIRSKWKKKKLPNNDPFFKFFWLWLCVSNVVDRHLRKRSFLLR